MFIEVLNEILQNGKGDIKDQNGEMVLSSNGLVSVKRLKQRRDYSNHKGAQVSLCISSWAGYWAWRFGIRNPIGK